MKLPRDYLWVDAVGDPPRMFQEMRKLYGIHETPGPGDNPVIMEWAKEVGLRDVYTHDEVPWCGLTMAVVAQRAGKAVVQNPLWALNWAKFGRKVDTPALGDTLVFKRQGGGHVGLYVAEDSTAFHVLGGNEGDAVDIVRIAKVRLYDCRRPKWKVAQPGGVRAFEVVLGGALSGNEA